MRFPALLPLTLFAALATSSFAHATSKRTAKIDVADKERDCNSRTKQACGRTARARTPEKTKPAAAKREPSQRKTSSERESSERESSSAPSRATASARQHRVARGETLSEIALRYDTSVEALTASNGLKKTAPLREGQLLSLPVSAKPRRTSWQPYVRTAKRKGWVEVSTPFARYSGQVVDSSGRLRPQAVRALNNLLGAGGTHPALPERLIRLLIETSDTFGGRPLRLVSGYRTNSYYEDSRHKSSSAVDFMVIGVPNAIVCDYLRELENVGVGYYPNSSFVHLDVRNHTAYWVDYAGPGEPPRSRPDAPKTPATTRPADRKLLAELDGLLQQANGTLEKATRQRATQRGSSAN